MAVHPFFEALLEFVFPSHCPGCGAYVPQRGGWCMDCLAQTLQIHRLPLEPAMARMIDSAWALGSYHGVLRDLIRSLKYQQRRSVLPCIAAFLREAQSQLPAAFQQAELAVPVPLHPDKEAKRGFNQTELIFKKWLAKKHFKCENNLKRIFFTQAQYKLRRQERLKNLQNAFSLKEGMTVSGKNCLLLDDIYTTGATLSACAKVLKRHGAAKIYGLVLATDAE